MPAPDSLARHKAGLLHFIPDYYNMAKTSLSEGSMDGKTTVKYLQDYIKSKDFHPDLKKDYFLKLAEEVGELSRAILFNGQKLNFTQNGNEVQVTFPEQYDKEPAYVLTIHKI